MLVEILGDLQSLPWVAALRRSRWVYPLVNTGHIIGLALLFGSIIPLDLRMLGLWRSIRLEAFSRVLLPVAFTGLVLAIITGFLLFSVRAQKYALLPVFQAKLVLIFAAIANALLLHASTVWAGQQGNTVLWPPWRLRLAAVLSMGLWTSVIICGRMIGYTD